ncbi:2og-fe oxygenase superfamily [Fusarium longipes]|uniref:2og-fe oxygenase superfamily n=1 Tax=Fusarium longipes TaxID=694270 RepID=A0A395RX00_9HYPO|nr:2og-fe oxygenase superfamily [Fusarium longipes]
MMSYPPPVVVEISDDDQDGVDSSAVLTNEDKHALLESLNSIQSTGNIAASSHYSIFVNPGLEIEGGNLISLPLKEDDAQTIKRACRQAPFGHGDKTLVDTSVRNTWELDALNFKLANPEWPNFFDGILRDTAAGLGLDEVLAKPYKLLLYEPGSFFKPHKDSEKERGMVGTLVVCLPSQHEGGDVHLSFGSQVKHLSTAPTSKFDLTSISWFSDVTHEVTKLASGYRLVLTYKLFIRGDGSFSASTALDKTEYLKSLLVKWKSRPSKPDRILYRLDHLYTEMSLCLTNLKGRDRAVAYSLNKISSLAGFYFMLAHATLVRRDSGWDDYGYGYDDEDPEGHTNLPVVYAPSGVCVASDVTIDNDEILGFNMDEESPDSEDEGEFTGNESMPSTFRYHKTVVILVPKDRLWKYIERNIDFCSLAPTDNDCMAEMVLQDLANNRDDTYTKQAATTFMEKILGCRAKPQGSTVGRISKCALELNNIEMFRACVRAICIGSRREIANGFPLFSHRKAISDELISYLRIHHDGREHAIDWNCWLIDLDKANDIATEFDAFCAVVKSSIEHGPLLESFEAWAGPIRDKKLASQTLWAISDETYLLHILESRNTDTEWILQSFLPMVVPRFHRPLLWSFLCSITAGRLGPFKNSKELYKCIIKHGRGQLSLCGNDIISRSTFSTPHFIDHDHDHQTPCKKFVRMLRESYMHGAGQEALDLLEQSCKTLIEERRVWLSTVKTGSPHTLVVTKLGTNYDRTLRLWRQGAEKVARSIYWMRRDYLKCLLGEERYNELVMLGDMSQENAATARQGHGDSAQPEAKRMRIWE